YVMESLDGKKEDCKRRSVIWTLFEFIPPAAASCTICKAKLSTKGGSTANLHRHLKSKHPTVQLEQVRQEPQPAPTVEDSSSTSTAPASTRTAVSTQGATDRPRARRAQATLTHFVSRPIDPMRQRAMDEVLAKMIALDLQPFSIVEDKGFRQYTKELNPNYVLPSRKTLSNSIIPELYRRTHEKVQERVDKAEAVCLTTDCWTSRTTTSFMSVTCHFISDFQNVSVLLDCLEMSDRHTADNLAEQLLRVAREWNIVHKVVACVSDNAANVVKAIQNTGWPHLFCFAHTLNLIVHSGIAAIKPTVDKVKATLGLPELRLKQDCPTCWNSTYYMLERILQNREAVITTLALTNPRLATLSPEEWEEMQQACNVLKPFEEVTVEISASKVILLARGLQKIASSHQRAAGNLSEPVRKLVDNICSQMSHQFHKIESHVLLSEAAALDPRFKKKAFRQDEAADNVFHRLCNSAARMTFPNQQAEGEEEGAEAQEGSSTQESAVWKEFDEQVFGLVTSSRNPTADSVLEVRGFIEEPLVPRSSNPLTWWQSRRVVYPRLCEFMKRRLCIVATSVPSERVFSKTGQIVSERRSRLSSSKVRQLVFINANLHM
uniref:BED-type domain-containing protein n=1 Tax=Labrus bergylta TaxID=56723 RepID=A0A3Q3FFT6_9LABR